MTDYKQLCEQLTNSERIIRDQVKYISQYLHQIEMDINKLRKLINKTIKENKK